MLEIMEAMSTASAGVDQKEQAVMDGFVYELTERFRRDIQAIG